ncbi:TetR family transcriptional regulator [Nitrosomonas ureae]|uniref:Transcriptional regulator, TetR family n=1 Tax=Nitrosomonas ureae TaxID=44577 RepID=A0A286A4U7_9PROT|nr:TetR family transcriptional regulator [Nitrosomonas ureae]PXX11642.1 TetR family transcriptional regulator [Nitrosomonas ureae]SOD16935.1 transcriptional regulator, TetR family [Nitrosomonas ureae]
MKKSKPELRGTIVDTAVALAESSSWEAVRLFDVAAELNISLDDIRLYFREKEDLIDAWFDQADGQMLRSAETVEFLSLSPRERLQHLIMAWLDALVAHRKITRQMIGAKLEPGHLHIQIPAIMRISRTVQWMREAAQRDATFLRRALEETALTTIYLATFTYWMQDSSENSQRTRDFLEHKLRVAESLDHRIYGIPCKETAADYAEQSVSASETSPEPQSSPLTEPIASEIHAKSG